MKTVPTNMFCLPVSLENCTQNTFVLPREKLTSPYIMCDIFQWNDERNIDREYKIVPTIFGLQHQLRTDQQPISIFFAGGQYQISGQVSRAEK